MPKLPVLVLLVIAPMTWALRQRNLSSFTSPSGAKPLKPLSRLERLIHENRPLFDMILKRGPEEDWDSGLADDVFVPMSQEKKRLQANFNKERPGPDPAEKEGTYRRVKSKCYITSNSTGLPESLLSKVGAKSSCKLSELEEGEATLVYPFGQTACLYGDPFAFQVWPGHTDKLLIHFEGGGACWDYSTTVTLPTCKMGIIPNLLMGPFNLCEEDSTGQPFKDYTVVVVQACSGDLHAGNVATPWSIYNTKFGRTVQIEQRGYNNARATINWIKANMPAKLSSLVLTGESAGAIGLQIWAQHLLSEFQYDSAQVIVDSYAGVFPPGFVERAWLDLGACKTNLLSDEHTRMCHEERLQIQTVFEATIAAHPNVSFTTLNSKGDSIQELFYKIAAESMVTRAREDNSIVVPDKLGLGPGDFYRELMPILSAYQRYPNFRTYLLAKGDHTPILYTYGECTHFNYEFVVPGFKHTSRCRHLANWLALWHHKAPLQASDPPPSMCEVHDRTKDSCNTSIFAEIDYTDGSRPLRSRAGRCAPFCAGPLLLLLIVWQLWR